MHDLPLFFFSFNKLYISLSLFKLMNKKGVNELVAAVILIGIVISATIIFGYFYTNFLYNQQDAINGTVFEEIGLQGTGGCSPNYAPGEWSECKLTYNLHDLVEDDLIFDESRSRKLEDLNKCAPNKVEVEKCSTKELISLQIVGQYLEIRDVSGNLVSKLELKDGALNIELTLV